MIPSTEELLASAIEFARLGGQHTLTHFRTTLEVIRKSDDSPVTVADRDAEWLIREAILKRYPDHGIIGEEHGVVNPSARVQWILDPIDGTQSFIHGIPLYTTLIGVLVDTQPTVGIIYAPAMDELCDAAIGHGTRLNGVPVRVRQTTDLSQATLITTDQSNIAKYGHKATIDALIDATPAAQIIVTPSLDRPIAKRWGQGRVTLLGDAAHPMTPNLGQGACQAIEDAFGAGDSQTAATATVELSKHLIEVKEHIEATRVVAESIERFAPWQGFELGVSYRSLAWSYKALDDNLRYEECMRVAIAHFDSCGEVAWAYPLRNELAELHLLRGDWSSLADMLASCVEETEEPVAPIARSIRTYLLGRLALHKLDFQVAIVHLLGSTIGLEKENHRLLDDVLDDIAWAMHRSGLGIEEALTSCHLNSETSEAVLMKLETRISRQTHLFL